MKFDQFLEETSHLNENEKIRLVDSLLDGLPISNELISDEWRLLAKARVSEIENGSVQTIAGEDVFKNLWKSLVY